MTIIAQDNFNTYTTGNLLNTLNGGSGFSAAWIATSGTTVGAPVSGNTNKVVNLATSTDNCQRNFSVPASNKIRLNFYVYKTSSSAMMFFGLILGGNEFRFVFDGGSWSQYRYNGINTGNGQTNPFPSINTWYKATITVDATTATNNIVFSVDNVAKATFSSSIASISSPIFIQAYSGFGTGMIFTDIQIDDMAVVGGGGVISSHSSSYETPQIISHVNSNSN